MNHVKMKCFIALIIGVGFFSYFMCYSANSFKYYGIQLKLDMLFQSRPTTPQANQKHAVRIIHQSWKDKNIPKQFSRYVSSWIAGCYRNWTYNLWTDEDNLKLVETHYPWFLERYNSFHRSIYRADVSRYLYMHRYGGIYTDLDNECLQPFEHLLVNYSLVFGAMDGQFAGTNLKEGYVQNSFFYSVPGHQFWLELLQAINEDRQSSIPEIQTGPVILSKFINSYRTRYQNDNTLRVYEPVYFNPFSWLEIYKSDKHCKDKGRMSDEDWTICRSTMKAKGSYVVQYHTHFWN